MPGLTKSEKERRKVEKRQMLIAGADECLTQEEIVQRLRDGGKMADKVQNEFVWVPAEGIKTDYRFSARVSPCKGCTVRVSSDDINDLVGEMVELISQLAPLSNKGGKEESEKD